MDLSDYVEAFARIEASIREETNPVSRLHACDAVYELARELIMSTGANGLRRDAANQAIKQLGLAAAAKQSGYTVSTLKRVAGR